MIDEDDIAMEAPASRRVPLVLMNIVCVLGLLISPVMIFGSIFMFDAPGSMSNPITNMILWGNLAMPVVMCAALLCSILGHVWRPKLFLVLSAAFVGGWLLYMIGQTIALEIVCNGTFSCGYTDPPLHLPA